MYLGLIVKRVTKNNKQSVGQQHKTVGSHVLSILEMGDVIERTIVLVSERTIVL